MNKQEVTQALVEIRDKQLETPGGVSVIAMVTGGRPVIIEHCTGADMRVIG
jgi:hypothetical protein